MKVNLSNINLSEPPILLLKNIDDTIVGTLGHAFDISIEFEYNEVSKLTFSYPEIIDDEATPFYDMLVGTRNVELLGIGTFKIKNPMVTDDGIRNVKTCSCPSLECELQNKTIILSEDTYCLFNPAASADTICSMFEHDTGWRIGTVDNDLIGRYRTFSVNENWYNFIKNTVQEKYGCVWEFDTTNRIANIRSVEIDPSVERVYLSLDNLAKKISIEEQTENIRTVLDVNGADGVDIRAVSPTGGNKIYNLDYYISKGLFPARLADKWQEWKSTYNASRVQYYNLTVQDIMNTQRLVSEQAAKVSLESEMKSLENILSVQISAQQDTSKIKGEIEAKQKEIDAKQKEIEKIEADGKSIQDELSAINKSLSFEVFYPDKTDLATVKRFFIEDALNESSFVYTEVNTYNKEAINKSNTTISVTLKGQFKPLDIESIDPDSNAKVELLNTKVTFRGKDYYRGSGISFELDQTDGTETRHLVGEAVSVCIEADAEKKFVMSIYAKVKTDDNLTVHANITASGVLESLTEGSSLVLSSKSASFYYTRNTSAYQRQAVEWDLYDYGLDALKRLAWPSYTFSVDSANFFSLEEFAAFKNAIQLGQRIYLEISDGNVMTPILTGLSLKYDDPSSLSLRFGDTYNSSDSAFRLKDLLGQSVSMGKTLDLGKFNYQSFINSGAQTNVGDFMNSAIDTALNAVTTGGDQAMMWDETGLRLRKQNESKTGYLPEQIWMTNNTILFSDDGWESGKMAIGAIPAEGGGKLYGIVGQYVVGKILAGNNLVIESEALAGENPVFRVDGMGAQLHNASFDLIRASGGRIGLDPNFGITAGSGDYFSRDDNGFINGLKLKDGSVVKNLSEVDWSKQNKEWKNPPKANFWVDMNGDVYLNGRIHADEGYFSGTVYATDGQFDGVIKAQDFLDKDGNSMLTNEGKFDPNYLDLMGITVRNDNGDVVLTIDQGGIKFTNTTEYQYAESSSGPWHSTKKPGDRFRRESTDGGRTWSEAIQFDSKPLPGYITEVGITKTTIESPTISAGEIIGSTIRGTEIYGGAYHDADNKTRLVLTSTAFGDTFPNLVYYALDDENKEYEAFKVRPNSYGTILSVCGMQILMASEREDTIKWLAPIPATFG